MFEQQKTWRYGVSHNVAQGILPVIYFEIPGCEQISFHCHLTVRVPEYPDKWDRKMHSTLPKLETAITNYLGLTVTCTQQR